MDKKQSLELCAALSNAKGAPGFEDEVLAVLRRYGEGLGSFREDSLRNLYLSRSGNQGGRPMVQLDAHTDEVAFMVQAVKPNGTLRFTTLGGWVPSNIPAHRVWVQTADGDYTPGVTANTVKPDLAISLDVTLAGDTKDLSTKFEDKMGQGACVHLYSFHGRGTLNGTLPHEPMFQLAKRTARELDLPLQRFASLGILTDSAYIQLEGQGVACLEMGFPARYTHTPVEVCDVRDIDALATVCAGMMRRIDKTFQINRY